MALAVPPENISAPPTSPATVAVVRLSPPPMWPACNVALYSGPLWAALRFGPRGAAG